MKDELKEELKVCTKCDKALPLSEYYVIKSSGYRYNYCRKCHYNKLTKHTSKKWRENNPERWLKDVSKSAKAYRDRLAGGVYLIYTDKGMYIGHTNALKLRINQHKTSFRPGNVVAKGAKYIHHIILAYEKNYYKRKKIEKYYINLLKPALNKENNPDWYKPGFGKKYEKRK